MTDGLGEFQSLALALVRNAHIHAEMWQTTRIQLVQQARDFGLSWEAIGGAMGMSRQRANNIFGQHVEPPDASMVERVERLTDLAAEGQDEDEDEDETG